LPRTLPDDQPPFRDTTSTSPEVLVTEIDGATLRLARRGAFVIVDRNGQPVEGGAVRGLDLAGGGSRPSRRERLTGTVCDLTAPGANHFSHFLFDALPKVHVLARTGIELANVDAFLVNSAKAKYQRDLLARAGIDLERVMERNRPGFPDVLEVERLVRVSPVRRGFFTPSWAIDFLRGLLHWSPQPGASGRVYLSRSDADVRRVANEAEVRKFVEARGFEVVSATNLAITEMAQLMVGSRCVVGAHGAGMANVVFASPPADVIELYGRHVVPECWQLCEQVGHRYHSLACAASDSKTDVDPRAPKHKESNYADIMVDLDRLGRMIESIP